MRPGSDDPTRMRGRPAAGWRLLLFWEGGSGTYPLGADSRVVIGRADDCKVRIPHDSVSRKHAVLTKEGGAWRIEDLGSSNGTILGGRVLRAGDRRVVGPSEVVIVGDARVVLDGADATAGGGDAGAPSKSSPALGEAMQRVMRLIELVSDSKLPVLLLGETGVGKGKLAEDIHRHSSRAKAPFLRLNCAAVPESLLESELFGHERGAFTGANLAKAGLLEAATGGTVFLDEIGEVPRSTQAKLLHVLEHEEVMRLGATKTRPIDVRFVAATNREIDELVAAGQFRKDLYFRLAGVPLRIPPLRERTEEIPAMVRAFLDEARAGTPIFGEALAQLSRYPWPGNIRELRNVVIRAALLSAGGEVKPEHLWIDGTKEPAMPVHERDPSRRSTKDLESELRDHERQCIAEALQMFGGHQGKAAKHLGISRRTLTTKLGQHSLPRPRKR
jgi:two-component system response regulator AtoC